MRFPPSPVASAAGRDRPRGRPTPNARAVAALRMSLPSAGRVVHRSTTNLRSNDGRCRATLAAEGHSRTGGTNSTGGATRSDLPWFLLERAAAQLLWRARRGAYQWRRARTASERRRSFARGRAIVDLSGSTISSAAASPARATVARRWPRKRGKKPASDELASRLYRRVHRDSRMAGPR